MVNEIIGINDKDEQIQVWEKRKTFYYQSKNYWKMMVEEKTETLVPRGFDLDVGKDIDL